MGAPRRRLRRQNTRLSAAFRKIWPTSNKQDRSKAIEDAETVPPDKAETAVRVVTVVAEALAVIGW
jgi:hypothetical protein